MAVASRVGAAALALVLTAALGSPASAGQNNGDGLWYFDLFDIQTFHDQGIDGSGVTIAMVDSPVNLEVPTLQGADITPHAPIGCLAADGGTLPATTTDFALAHHGTSVASLLVGSGAGYPGQQGVKGIAPGATLLTYAVYDTEVCVSVDGADPLSEAINAAVNDGADIVSVSLGTLGSESMNDAILNALVHDVIVVAALPNKDSNIGLFTAPFSYNGVAGIAALTPEGKPATAVWGGEATDIETDLAAPGADMLEQGTDAGGWEAQDLAGGTSFATPIVAGEIALALQKYPEATPNQVLQSLIHNTGSQAHELNFDSTGTYGYGIVDAISFLAADPTQYDDANPFIEEHSRLFQSTGDAGDDFSDEFGYGPTIALIESAKSGASASPSASPDASDAPDVIDKPSPDTEDESNSTLLLLIGGGVLLLVLVGVGIAVAIASTKNKGGRA